MLFEPPASLTSVSLHSGPNTIKMQLFKHKVTLHAVATCSGAKLYSWIGTNTCTHNILWMHHAYYIMYKVCTYMYKTVHVWYSHLGTQLLHPHNDSNYEMQCPGADILPVWFHFQCRTHCQGKWVHHLAQMLLVAGQWLLKMEQNLILLVFFLTKILWQSNFLTEWPTHLLNWVPVVYKQQQHLYYPKSHHTLCPRPHCNRSPPYQMFRSLTLYHQPVWRLCHCTQESALRVQRQFHVH